MRSRLLVAAVAIAIAATPAITLNSSAQTEPTSVAKIKATKYRILFTFDKRESLRAGTRVRDVSHHRNGGLVVVQSGGKLRSVKGAHGRGADFPNRCPSCGRALIEVHDRLALNPGFRNFTFGSSIRLTSTQAIYGSNIVQKGYFNQPGGQFKLQLEPGGFPSCVFNGSVSRLRVTSSVAIANHKWHRVSCTRGKYGLAVRVDGKVRGGITGQVGFIKNTAPIRIGAKKISPPNKQFRGVLDNVYLRFLPTA